MRKFVNDLLRLPDNILTCFRSIVYNSQRGDSMNEMTKEELEKLYYETTNDKVCEILGVSKCTLVSMLNRAGIKLKGKGSRLKWNIK